MTKISKKSAYPIKKPIVNDYFVGTDIENNLKTVNFSFKDSAKLINKINGDSSLDYKFIVSDNIPLDVLTEGVFLSETNETEFTLITKLYINRFNNSGDDLHNLLNYIKINATDFQLKIKNYKDLNIEVYFNLGIVENFGTHFSFEILMLKSNPYLIFLKNLDLYFLSFYIKSSSSQSGNKGDKGDQGNEGDKGDKGDKGDSGVKGDAGTNGLNSTVAGPKGDKGEKGEKGDAGINGLNSTVAGPKGDKGNPFVYSDFTAPQLSILKGLKGDIGNTGAKGDKGDQGPQGIQGIEGDQGLAGIKGDQGNQGEQGQMGDTGLRGFQGEQGIQGFIGMTGDKGDKGDSGSAGLKGDQGTQGIKGDQGIQGPAGINGGKGDAGLTGNTGSKGDTGLTGSKGDKGDKGNDGTSVTIKGELPNSSALPPSGSSGDAYLITGNLWVWNGTAWANVGTIQGPQGVQGSQGPKGDTGLTGNTGLKGDIGNNGSKGDKGEVGITGAKGDKGDNGINGASGLKGDKGDKGDQGLIGMTGAQGNTGNQGYKGDQGTQGIQGVKGDQGAPGTNAQNITHTGEVTGATVLTIANKAVTNAKLADLPAKTYIGRTTNSIGSPENVTVAQLKNDLSLNNVENTDDLSKPISTATQTALSNKFDKSGGVISGILTVDGGQDYISSFFKANLLIDGNYYSSILIGKDKETNKSIQFGSVINLTDIPKSFAHITPYGATEGSVYKFNHNGDFTTIGNVTALPATASNHLVTKAQLEEKNNLISHLEYNNTDKTIWSNGKGNIENNSSYGFSSLKSNTYGSNNVGNGFNTLKSNTSGDSNTANGSGSLESNISGAGNSGSGTSSLQSNIDGSFNTAGGTSSLRSNISGGNNTANGSSSGRFISDGVSLNTVTNNSVFLGANTKPLANSQGNQIVIGYDAIGAGSNTATLGNTNITQTVLRGAVTANSFARLNGSSNDAQMADGTIKAIGNINNTTDLLKPISTATQTALGLKQNTLTAGSNITISGNTISATGGANSRPYKVYTALLSQSGTRAPTAIIEENTLGSPVTWSWSSNGFFLGTIPNNYPNDKIFVFISQNDIDKKFNARSVYGNPKNYIYLNARSEATGLGENGLGDLPIEIRVYNSDSYTPPASNTEYAWHRNASAPQTYEMMDCSQEYPIQNEFWIGRYSQQQTTIVTGMKVYSNVNMTSSFNGGNSGFRVTTPTNSYNIKIDNLGVITEVYDCNEYQYVDPVS